LWHFCFKLVKNQALMQQVLWKKGGGFRIVAMEGVEETAGTPMASKFFILPL